MLSIIPMALVVLAGCKTLVWVEATEEIRVPAAGVDRLVCTTDNGAIAISGSAQPAPPEIVAKVRKRAGGYDEDDARAALAALRPTAEHEDAQVTLGWEWQEPHPRHWSAAVSFDVSLPPAVAVSAATSNGPITVRGTEAACDVRTSNGAVIVEGATGSLRAHTSNGAVDLRTAAAQVDVRTSNGNVTASLQPAGRLDGTIHTSNGAVTLAFGDHTSTTITCATSNGRIRTERAARMLDSDVGHMRAALGSGDGSFSVSTSNGRVTVR